MAARWMDRGWLSCSPITYTTGTPSCSVVRLPAERARLRSQHMNGAMQPQQEVNAVLVTDPAIEPCQLR